MKLKRKRHAVAIIVPENPRLELPAANLQSNLVGLEPFLSTNSDPAQQFEAIDREVRRVESVVTGWPKLAKYCQMVKDGELFQHGGYKTMTDWLENAAPKSARSIMDYMSLHKNLSPDFTDEEQSQMPVETAKLIAKKVTSREHRKNPQVKAASKKKKAQCMKEVNEALPDLHLEDIENVVFPTSQLAAIDSVCDYYREKEGDPDMSRQDAIEGALTDYKMLRERLDAIEVETKQ